MNELQKIWIEKLSKGEEISSIDLKRFSNIKLKRKRVLKKFLKNPVRYISEKIWMEYFGILLAQPIAKSFKMSADFNLSVEPIDGPKGELFYFDKK